MKKIIFIVFIFSCFQSCSKSQGILGAPPRRFTPAIPPASFAEFEAMAETVNERRYASNPIITYVTDTWKARQVHFPFIIENPNNPDSLIMFYGGGSYLESSAFRIGRAVASKANPYVWEEYEGNPIFSGTSIGLGIGSIVGVDDAWWNPTEERFELVCGTFAGAGEHLARYISDDGFNFSYQGTGMILPSGDETHVGNGGILREDTIWYCAYTYRTADSTLPGIRIASSTDSGATWTKHGKFLHLGTAGAYDDLYIEGLQFLKIGSDYVLNYGAAKNGTITFSGALAYSTSALGTYTKSSINPFFEKSVSGWDDTNVSTVVYFELGGTGLFFYQGTNSVGDYNLALWSMGIARLW